MNSVTVPVRRSLRHAPSLLTVAGLFLVSVLVLASKAPDALTVPQFWAEDGAVFFLAQHGRAMPQLFEPYAGYLHALPRLVAWIAGGFSAVHAPLIYNLCALLIGAAALTSLRRLDRLGVGFLLAMVPIALAPTNGEVWGTITNVQWVTQFYLVSALVRLFLGDDDSIPLLRAVAAVAVGLSGPFGIFAVAAALIGTLWSRWFGGPEARVRRAGAPISAEWIILGLCAGIQILTIVNAGGTKVADAPAALDAYLVFVESMPLHVFGTRLVPTWLFLGVLGALFVFVLKRSTAPQRTALVAIAAFVALQLAAAAHKCASDQPEQLLSFGFGDRYFLLFKVTFWWLVAIAIARVAPSKAGYLPTAALVVLLGGNAAMMPGALQRQPYQDMNWADYAKRIDAGEGVDVPINPPSWRIHVPARP